MTSPLALALDLRHLLCFSQLLPLGLLYQLVNVVLLDHLQFRLPRPARVRVLLAQHIHHPGKFVRRNVTNRIALFRSASTRSPLLVKVGPDFLAKHTTDNGTHRGRIGKRAVPTLVQWVGGGIFLFALVLGGPFS